MRVGCLASFSNVTEAVLCAGHIQKATKDISDLKLRIGIHLGDVVFENNDVFGDGVNIASRIMAQAQSRSIFISESVHSNVSNKKGITTNFLREELLKNVKEPVRIYEVSVDGSVIPDAGTTHPVSGSHAARERTGKPVDKSIAVLPFVNMSNDQEQEYFSDGITEEILNSLAQIKVLRVAGRTSSFHFKGKNIDLREIGQLLNVHTVLEGSVRKQGNKLRITAQLINVDDGYHIWSERYDREMDDLFAIQDEIALAITEKLKITLLEDEKAEINKKPTDNKEAYDLYLKGRFHFNKRGPGIIKGIEYFQLALREDPQFALAYTGLADAYCILAFYGAIAPHQAMPKAKQYAEKAIELNPSRVEAFTALAFISTFYDWNWQEAASRFKKAFETNPNYASSYYWHSYYLSFIAGNDDEAIREAKKASEILEPLVPISHHVLAIMYIMAGKYQEGLQSSKLAIELDAHSYPGYRSLGLSLAGLGQFEEAIAALQKAVQYAARQSLSLVELCWVYYLTGNTTEIKKIAEELLERSRTEFISSTFLCCIAYYSGNADEAIQHLEKAFVERDSVLPCLKRYPLSEFARTDPRFQPFVKRMNFPA